MGQASITLAGRSYRLSCGDGEESRLQELSAVVRDKLEPLVAEFGHVGDERLLLIADEMLDARACVEALETALLAVQAGKAVRNKEPA